ncbi:MAG: TlpA family protein disulfide reductase [Muribaculaceae bacterium]|nr:hypothetical protein [Muribaculaceae bacterium]
MKKTMLCIVSFALMLVSLSASVDKGRGAQFGKEAPTLVVERADSATSLQALKGKKVILSFWSAADAQSRIEQNRIASLTADAAGNHKDFEVLSVNFDRSERLMNEIVKIDNLDSSSQCHVGNADNAAAIREAFSMKNSLRTFIIDEKGRIVCADPTEQQLLEVIG